MNSDLRALKIWLEDQYEGLGLRLSEFARDVSGITWLASDGDYADLLDRELGAWVRFSSLSAKSDVRVRVLEDVRWALSTVSKLDVRSRLERTQADELGAWQVHVIWLVPSECKASWEASIRDLRRRSAHPEEIGLDLIDLSAGRIEDVLRQEGVPSLLLHTRALNRLDSSSVPKWLSPDSLFEEQLRRYVAGIADENQRAFSQEVAKRFLIEGDRARELDVVSVPVFDRATFQNLRNIVDADIEFDFSGMAAVVHGPNGSGKSSLFEGLCLALFGTSKRHHDFLSDGDVNPKAKGDYVGTVLTRFDSSEATRARVILDGADADWKLASSASESLDRLNFASGTVLAQESARDFVGMDSRKAASLVLGDYSPKARRFQEDVERGAAQSRVAWQDWLRSLGLTASINKQETIIRKLVGREISAQCPPLSISASGWLTALGARFPVFEQRSRELLFNLRDADSAETREEVGERVAVAIEKSGSAAAIIERWLTTRDDAIRAVSALSEESRVVLDALRAEWPRIRGEVQAWAQWLQQPRREAPSLSIDDIERTARDSGLRAKLAELTPRGQHLKARKEHLEQLLTKVMPDWVKGHPHACPSCEAQHEREIALVVSEVAAGVEAEYQRVRSEYVEAQVELRDLQVQAGKAGVSPLSDERIVELSALLGFDAKGPESLEALILAGEGRWGRMLHETEALFAGPIEISTEDRDAFTAKANGIVGQVVVKLAEGARKQELPLKWDELKKKVDETALDIVSNHLPRTVGAVWNEIALALAPSRWNQAAVPRMQMDINRGNERLGIIIDGNAARIPARHVLNQAEQHVLGLAWFFTRHLSHGRFVAPLIALDDPAQEMDQVTYRRFVRFLQAFLRMHRYLGRQFSAMVLLHQEERALDLARAASRDGGLTMLEWSREIRAKGPDATVRQFRLRNAEQMAPLPPPLCEPAQGIVSA